MGSVVMYEYKIISGSSNAHKWSDVDEQLNALVREGWEIDQTVASATGMFGLGTGGFTAVLIFVLRRPRT
jgi:hypothetical protein